MMDNAVIVSAGAISPLGNNLEAIKNNYQRAMQDEFNKAENFDFYSYSYKVKTYIDRSSQLCIHAINQLFNKESLVKNDMLGLITVSKYACEVSLKKGD